MTDEPKHSPLPWKSLSILRWVLLSAEGYTVAELLFDRLPETRLGVGRSLGDKQDEWFANVELVLRRVNEGPAVDKKLSMAEKMARFIWEIPDPKDNHEEVTSFLAHLMTMAREFIEANEG